MIFDHTSNMCLCAGPGVGKGRQIASLVFENLLRCRKKVCPPGLLTAMDNTHRIDGYHHALPDAAALGWPAAISTATPGQVML